MRPRKPFLLALFLLLGRVKAADHHGLAQMMHTIDCTLRLERESPSRLDHSSDFENDITIQSHVLNNEGRALYEFCYARPQNLLDCLRYNDVHVIATLIHFDINLKWLPSLKHDLPRPIESEIFQPRSMARALPPITSAKFLYYNWYRYATRIVEDMLESSTGALLAEMRYAHAKLVDLSAMILSTQINLRDIWAQYRMIYASYPGIQKVYHEWSGAITLLHQRLVETVATLSDQQRHYFHLQPIKERFAYIKFTNYLFDFLKKCRPGWYDHMTHSKDRNMLDAIKKTNTDLVIPILLRQQGYPHAIDYRDAHAGEMMRLLNGLSRKEVHVSKVIETCSSDPKHRQLCVIVGVHLMPCVFTGLLQYDIDHIIQPYRHLIHQVRLFEDSSCVREWTRRLQGMYKDLSNFFPQSMKHAELDAWTSRGADQLTLQTPLLALYDYFHKRGKYMWIHLFNYLVADLTYWRQEVQKLSFVLAHSKRNKALTPFNPQNCQEDQSLYSCIASIHHHVYQMDPTKLTQDKHYILFGNLHQLTEDVQKLVGITTYQTGLEAFRRSRSTPYREILPAQTRANTAVTTAVNNHVSKWSPDSSEDEQDGRLKRSATTIRHPRQIYKAIGRALSER